ncbi:thiamine phosphate synthase [Rhizobium sp. YIM 134829]|uniref:thiamine phosphate synthase n=1 Tax=Rhizobium sp. YIM 134829 TaxID=3390453 RepID=UPI00397CEADB
MTKVDLRLNAIVDASLADVADLPLLAAQAVRGGATLLQYRDKTASTRRMVEQAMAIIVAIAGSGVPLLVNDRVDVALAAGADGVHLGSSDLDPETARRLLGPSAIIGLSVKTAEEAHRAALAPADYACIGGVFATTSKDNPGPPLGIDGYRLLRKQLHADRPTLPVGAIAGITEARIAPLIAAGADGVAVIAALFRSGDVIGTARAFRSAVDAALSERSA